MFFYIGLKGIVNSLLKSLPTLFNVLPVIGLFLVTFGILGIQFFKGKVSYCNDKNVNIVFKKQCKGKFKLDGKMTDREWITPMDNYDNIFNSMTTFFEVSFLEGFPNIMFAAIDSREEDMTPKVNNKQWVAGVFILYVVLTSFVILQLSASILVDQFIKETNFEAPKHFSTREKKWMHI